MNAQFAKVKELHHGPEFSAQVGWLLPGFEVVRKPIRNEDMASLPL